MTLSAKSQGWHARLGRDPHPPHPQIAFLSCIAEARSLALFAEACSVVMVICMNRELARMTKEVSGTNLFQPHQLRQH